jgi:hypothetical protein
MELASVAPMQLGYKNVTGQYVGCLFINHRKAHYSPRSEVL